MREIKFRAWDLQDEGWWIDFLVDNHTGQIVGAAHPENSVLMQFTGLLDKNGVEVYEGDVVDHFGLVKGFLGRYEVRWGRFGFTLWDKERPDVNSHYISPDTPSSWLIVVGNIYSNLELLS